MFLQIAAAGSSTWRTVKPGGYTPDLFGTRLASGADGLYILTDNIDDVTKNQADLNHPVPNTLYRSRDDGASWQTLRTFNSNDKPSVPLDQLAVAADGSVSFAGLVGEPGTDATTAQAAIGMSTNGGASFGPARIVPTSAASDGAFLAGAVSGSSAVSADGSGSQVQLYLSQNQGQTWVRTHAVATASKAFRMRFTSALVGVVTIAGAKMILVTADGGKSWTERAF